MVDDLADYFFGNMTPNPEPQNLDCPLEPLNSLNPLDLEDPLSPLDLDPLTSHTLESWLYHLAPYLLVLLPLICLFLGVCLIFR